MSYFPRVESWTLPIPALRASLDEMSKDGLLEREGVAFWLGRRPADGRAEVTHVALVAGAGVFKHRALLQLSPSLMNDLTDAVVDLGVCLIGQIHSHPTDWVDLSETDRQDGIAVPYYLSLVVPHYGRRSGRDLSSYGVHVFEPDGGFRRLSVGEVRRRICLTDTPATVITIGG